MAVQPNVFDAQCGSRQVLNLIGDRWTMLVLYALRHDARRYGELLIGGISQKMLTQVLRKLERDGIVARKVYPVVPPHVEYRLTPLGKTLLRPLSAICRWAEEHLSEIAEAQLR
jgi:DNA-binding HxlR family transcriptional regulator